MLSRTIRISGIAIGVGTTGTPVDVDGKDEPLRLTIVPSGAGAPPKQLCVDDPIGRVVTGRRRGDVIVAATLCGGRRYRIAYVER